MLKKLSLGLFVITLLFACSKDANISDVTIASNDLMSKEEINRILYKAIEDHGVYSWEKADARLMHSAALQSDSVFAIGYQIAGMQDLDSKIHEIDIESAEWVATRDRILNVILEGEQALDPDKGINDLLPFGYPEVLPSMSVVMTNINTIERLRNMEEVRYLEAMGYELPLLNAPQSNNAVQRSGSGCDNGVPSYNLNSADYTTITPNVKRGWNLATSNVQNAWNTTTGSGVTIAIIDTGISDSQENLGSQFNSGYSSGRFVQRYSTKYSGSWWWKSLDPPHDDCGHGTRMAGIATAPRGSDGNAVGIAYNANLIGIRAVSDVYISGSNDKNGVKNALILAGNRSDVKVISMSIGTLFSSGTVSDGLVYAYNKGKLIFAAAGTSFSWTGSFVGVIYPASHWTTTAVTGVKQNNPMTRCNNCHQGSQVEFVMRMQRNSNNDRVAVSLANYSNQPAYSGGSSCATASLAGISALVFANNPGISRAGVLNKLKVNASNYPFKSSNFGWGVVDASAAIN